MNKQYDNTNRGQIWPNDRKETENHPDFTGSLNVDGKEFWVSAWKRKEGANPKAPSLSFSIKAKDDATRQSTGVAGAAETANGFEKDDIPF